MINDKNNAYFYNKNKTNSKKYKVFIYNIYFQTNGITEFLFLLFFAFFHKT